jgi:hypothetical protein
VAILAAAPGGVWLIAAANWLSGNLRPPIGPVATTVTFFAGLGCVGTAFINILLLIDWARWRRRNVPAMRLTPAGLDYSVAFDGTFPLHVEWTAVQGSEYRHGVGGSWLWCVDVHVSVMLKVTSPFIVIHLIHPIHPNHARLTAARLAREARASGEEVNEDLVTHMLAFGTPIAIDLRRIHGVPWEELDEHLREWTQGRCTVRPDRPDQQGRVRPG